MMVVEAIPGRQVKKGDILVCNQETARVVTPVQAWPVVDALSIDTGCDFGAVKIKIDVFGNTEEVTVCPDQLLLVVR